MYEKLDIQESNTMIYRKWWGFIYVKINEVIVLSLMRDLNVPSTLFDLGIVLWFS